MYTLLTGDYLFIHNYVPAPVTSGTQADHLPWNDYAIYEKADGRWQYKTSLLSLVPEDTLKSESVDFLYPYIYGAADGDNLFIYYHLDIRATKVLKLSVEDGEVRFLCFETSPRSEMNPSFTSPQFPQQYTLFYYGPLVAAAYGGELRRWGVTLADGGKERFDSVRGGLAALEGDFPFVAIHDAARPCFTADLARRVLHAAELIGGAIPASRSTATIKRGTDDSSEEFPLIRRTLWEAETPQIFRLDLYRQAAERYGSSEVTDDAALFERAGLPVALVESDHKNPKITTAWDLSIAGMILG